MSGTADVSVVIPAFNRENYLAESIESVLAQTTAPRQIIVVDDGSSDATVEVARSFPQVTVLLMEVNSGIGAARNRGVEAATGEFLAFHDSDDLWTPGKLEAQFEEFEKDPTVEAVYGWAEQFLSPELDPSTLAVPLGTEPIPATLHACMLIRRASFLRVGPYDTALRVGEAIDWEMKATEAGLRRAMVPGVVLRRRVHATNTVIERRAAFTDYFRILKAGIDRRRAAAADPERR